MFEYYHNNGTFLKIYPHHRNRDNSYFLERIESNFFISTPLEGLFVCSLSPKVWKKIDIDFKGEFESCD